MTTGDEHNNCAASVGALNRSTGRPLTSRAPDHGMAGDRVRDHWASPSVHQVAWYREALALGVLYLVFELLRDLIPTRIAVADAHAVAILGAERQLHIAVEGSMQRAALTHHWIVDTASTFYATGYVISTVGVLVWLARLHPQRYTFWRNALIATTSLGLVGYYVYPTAPPRLLTPIGEFAQFGLLDRSTSLPGPWSLQASLVTTMANPYAAMPSLHCAWAMWVASVVAANGRHPLLRSAVWAYPLVTVVVVLVTGNHFVLDIVAGMGVSALGIALAFIGGGLRS